MYVRNVYKDELFCNFATYFDKSIYIYNYIIKLLYYVYVCINIRRY